MLALDEFANFVRQNMANLVTTYTHLLIERQANSTSTHLDSRLDSAHRLLNAVVEACRSKTSHPLCRLYEGPGGASPLIANDDPGLVHPLLEIECLGQTLIPIVTSLEASQFLWQMLSDVRLTILQAMENLPASGSGFAKNRDTRREEISPGDTGHQEIEATLQQTLERHPQFEQAAREITDQLRTAPNLDSLLETAARELSQRLDVPHAVLELGIESDRS